MDGLRGKENVMQCIKRTSRQANYWDPRWLSCSCGSEERKLGHGEEAEAEEGRGGGCPLNEIPVENLEWLKARKVRGRAGRAGRDVGNLFSCILLETCMASLAGGRLSDKHSCFVLVARPNAVQIKALHVPQSRDKLLTRA